ncbi:MAG: hypothetical protein IPJ20_13395 [Flammeovirgaceae bacterium]|nr:hypothetical protein [Flammeovirgaceae bacterium]
MPATGKDLKNTRTRAIFNQTQNLFRELGAEYIYPESGLPLTWDQKCLIMDIGGGSVEFVVAEEQVSGVMVLEIGGQRLLEKISSKNDPIKSQEVISCFSF